MPFLTLENLIGMLYFQKLLIMNKIYYKNIFIYSSLQFTGNVEEYFVQHSEKLVAFVLMPRQQPDSSLVRLYKKGKLIEERKIKFFNNVFLYYFLWYIYQIFFIVKYFSKREKVSVITFHPNTLFGITLQKMIRNIEFVYWIADYFPPVSTLLIFYEKLKKFYSSKVRYVCYLSDKINEIMNGKIVDTLQRKTVMWGILPKNIKRNIDKNNFTILFVGVIRESQGLEFVFDFLKTHKDYSIKIIGEGDSRLFDKYKKIIKEHKISNQVFFPNRFFEDSELEEISKSCQVGIAAYDIDKTSATYYTDPGKIKTYASLGLPIIMSNVSAIAPYVEKFGCGKVIQKRDKELEEAFLDIKNNYEKYVKGVNRFNEYFFYDTYYKKSFNFLEKYE